MRLPFGALAAPRGNRVAAGGCSGGVPARGERGAGRLRACRSRLLPRGRAGGLLRLKCRNVETVLSLWTRLFASGKLSRYRCTSCMWKSCSIYSSKVISVLFKCCGAVTLPEERFFFFFFPPALQACLSP